MVRWIKLRGNQHLGFWVLGLALFALQEVPYMVMSLLGLVGGPILDMTETSAVLNVCEKVLGFSCVALMILVVHEDARLFSVAERAEQLFLALAVVVLGANYAGWVLYFNGHRSLFVVMFFIVAMPPLYYMAIGLWRRNGPLVITGVIFLAIHFVHVLGNLSTGPM